MALAITSSCSRAGNVVAWFFNPRPTCPSSLLALLRYGFGSLPPLTPCVSCTVALSTALGVATSRPVPE